MTSLAEFEKNLHRHKIATFAIVGFLALLSLIVIIISQQTSKEQTYKIPSKAQEARLTPSLPANDRARGLVFDGLEIDEQSCPNGFKVQLPEQAQAGLNRPLCTHGPDPVPTGFDINQSAPPVETVQGVSSKKVLGTTVTCDGDGVSGKRIQVLYVHASDIASRYAQVLNSIQTFVSNSIYYVDSPNGPVPYDGADRIFYQSALETGGTRNLRFVHDTACNPVVEEVTLSPTGDDTFGNTISELQAQGYKSLDRKYLVFVDAQVYCGIGTIAGDDRPGSDNANNLAPNYARTDAGCWSGVIPAHELMHNLGGVQVSAPHADGGYHCTDGYDDMCDHGTSPNKTFTSCPNTIGDQRMDCNHDDYFIASTPAADNYLWTHWNTANSIFLIGPTIPFITPTPPPPTPTPTLGANQYLQVRITNPQGGTTLPAKGSIKISANAASYPYAVSKMEILIDGSIVKSCRNSNSCETNWSLSRVSSGQHTIQANATNTASQTGSASVAVTKP